MSTRRSSPVVALALALTAILATAAGLWLGRGLFLQAPPPTPTLKAGTWLPTAKPLPAFTLTDGDGAPLTRDSLRGRFTFVFFGYATCPDICPLTLATFTALERHLAAQGRGETAQFLMVSVDPERDTPERLGQYVRHFNPRFRAATGPHEVLRSLTAHLGVIYRRAEDQETALGYLVDHSASILLIDPAARLAAIFSTPHDPRAIADDFSVVASNYQGE